MGMRITKPMETVLTGALGRALRTPEGETVYQVDVLGVTRTVAALQRRGLVVMEVRTVLDGNGREFQATTSWLTAEGVAAARRLTGAQQGGVEESQEPEERPGRAVGAVGAQEVAGGGRAAVVARLDAVWSAGYVTGPRMSLEERRVAAEVVADYYTAGGARLLHGCMDRDAVVAEFSRKSTYDLMDAYGSVRLATGGDVWALVARLRTGERVEALTPVVERAAGALRWSSWSMVVRSAAGDEGPSNPVASGVVAPMLAVELSYGGTLHRHATGVLRLTREDGTRLVLRPVV